MRLPGKGLASSTSSNCLKLARHIHVNGISIVRPTTMSTKWRAAVPAVRRWLAARLRRPTYS